MHNYRVWGEYGPCFADHIMFYCRAKSAANAKKRAIALFKNTDYWERIGEHNVHVDQVFP